MLMSSKNKYSSIETSVIMTSYNYENFISDAIESVIEQSYKDWELLIVDDGSEDNSLSIINAFVDKYPDRIRLFTHPQHQNKGIKASYELGLSLAKAPFIAFLESDDRWKSDCLRKKVSALKENPEAAIAFSGLELLPDKNVNTKRYEHYLEYSRYVGLKCIEKPKDLSNIILFRNPAISFSNIVVRKSAVDGLELIKEHEVWSDWQLVVNAASKGSFIYIDEKLLYWRLHQKSGNYDYMKSEFKSKDHDFKQRLSKKYKHKKINNHIPEYPYNIITMFVKFFHDFGFVIRHPDISWAEIINKTRK